eukprot:Tbor_TRINITY_DN5523_c1_g1::TRINITY_DN5523_c1_g1_i4::g.12809::m.12809
MPLNEIQQQEDNPNASAHQDLNDNVQYESTNNTNPSIIGEEKKIMIMISRFLSFFTKRSDNRGSNRVTINDPNLHNDTPTSSVRDVSAQYGILWSKGRLLRHNVNSVKYYVGYDSVSDNVLFAKEIPLYTFSNLPTRLAQYRREIQVHRRLRHRNVLQYKGVSNTKEALYTIYQFIPCGWVYDLLDQFGAFPEYVAAVYMLQILEGVSYLHSNRVILHNIKCSNLLISVSGVLKIFDFGSAFSVDEVMKSPDVRKGTRWMAPEVLRGEGPTYAADIWSIGCTLLEMLTGKYPFHHLGSIFNVMLCVGNPDLEMPLPIELNGISDSCRDFLRMCFMKHPSERPTAAYLLSHPFIRVVGAREVPHSPRENLITNRPNIAFSSVFELLDIETSKNHQDLLYEWACRGVPFTSGSDHPWIKNGIECAASPSTNDECLSDTIPETSIEAEEMIYRQIYAQEKIRYDERPKGKYDIFEGGRRKSNFLSQLMVKIGRNIRRNTQNRYCAGDRQDSHSMQNQSGIPKIDGSQMKKDDVTLSGANVHSPRVSSNEDIRVEDPQTPLVNREKTELMYTGTPSRPMRVTYCGSDDNRVTAEPQQSLNPKFDYKNTRDLNCRRRLHDESCVVVAKMTDCDTMTLFNFLPIAEPGPLSPRTGNIIVIVSIAVLFMGLILSTTLCVFV